MVHRRYPDSGMLPGNDSWWLRSKIVFLGQAKTFRPRQKYLEAEAKDYKAEAEVKIWHRVHFGLEALTYLVYCVYIACYILT